MGGSNSTPPRAISILVEPLALVYHVGPDPGSTGGNYSLGRGGCARGHLGVSTGDALLVAVPRCWVLCWGGSMGALWGLYGEGCSLHCAIGTEWQQFHLWGWHSILTSWLCLIAARSALTANCGGCIPCNEGPHSVEL